MEPFQRPEVESVFAAYPEKLKTKLLQLRQLIFETASELESVGPLEETLKWGQPSYLTSQSGSGTTIRIDRIAKHDGRYGLFVHCQTSLLESYRELYPDVLTYEGKRCIEFDAEEDPPRDVLKNCIALALTYHLKDKRDQLPF